MKMFFEFKLLILLCSAIAIGGCGAINETKSAENQMNNSETDTNEISELLKPISDYILVHVEGEKQAVFYDAETKKIVIQAELTSTEVTKLYSKFNKNNIKIEPIDGEFTGIMPNDKENHFAP
ncbi:hypothetical protein J2W91_004587 [Paenibacillus amylolyticus]|uniref:Uncharacterized protein n=1 Tax=Paenibacillus amylolyticus TaxID=1451 RepID=A0AAP5LPA0_PAEAM|nr:hypothetical protein [Paenibacillus amylolyticus]MDR6726081.1 hypothetical protein [Paenibacillus amylolyticus]